MQMRSKATILFAVLAALATPLVAHGQGQPVRIAVEGNFPPFNYLDANGQLQGFDVEIAGALCASMQVECTMAVQDWDNMIPGLNEDKYDAIVSSMSMSAQRREIAAFTERYYDSPSNFITAKDANLRSFTSDDLAGRKLGVTLSTSQLAYVQDRFAKSEIVVFASSPELYRGLAAGEVEVILEDKLAAFDWLNNTRAGQCCEFRGDDIKEATYFGDGAGIAVRKDDEDLLLKLNKALADITDNGTYAMINAKYFPFSIR